MIMRFHTACHALRYWQREATAVCWPIQSDECVVALVGTSGFHPDRSRPLTNWMARSGTIASGADRFSEGRG
jgi:hypothetical protein